jgi:hypothetical protein
LSERRTEIEGRGALPTKLSAMDTDTNETPTTERGAKASANEAGSVIDR